MRPGLTAVLTLLLALHGPHVASATPPPPSTCLGNGAAAASYPEIRELVLTSLGLSQLPPVDFVQLLLARLPHAQQQQQPHSAGTRSQAEAPPNLATAQDGGAGGPSARSSGSTSGTPEGAAELWSTLFFTLGAPQLINSTLQNSWELKYCKSWDVMLHVQRMAASCIAPAGRAADPPPHPAAPAARQAHGQEESASVLVKMLREAAVRSGVCPSKQPFADVAPRGPSKPKPLVAVASGGASTSSRPHAPSSGNPQAADLSQPHLLDELHHLSSLLHRLPKRLCWPLLRRMVVAALIVRLVPGHHTPGAREGEGTQSVASFRGNRSDSSSSNGGSGSSSSNGGSGSGSSSSSDGGGAAGPERQDEVGREVGRAVALICLQLFRLQRTGAGHKGVVDFMHVSKSGGTSFCQLAQMNRCSTQVRPTFVKKNLHFCLFVYQYMVCLKCTYIYVCQYSGTVVLVMVINLLLLMKAGSEG